MQSSFGKQKEGEDVKSSQKLKEALYMRVSDEMKEESENVCLKLNIQKTMIMASGPIISWQRWGNNDRLYFLGLQNHGRW